MVNYPDAYPWSSHSVNSGIRSDPFVSPHAEFLALSTDSEKQHASYRALFADEIEQPLLEAIRDSTNAGYPLASEGFKTAVIAPLGWKTAPGKPGPRSNSGPDPELGKRVVALTPN
jgi:putative transposase